MANRHELKTWPNHFAAVRERRKKFEIRYNDRDFQLGDVLVLREFDQATNTYTGRVEERVVEYMLAEDEFGPLHGYVAIGFGDVLSSVEVSIDSTLTREDLAAWHRRESEAAAQRAANSRRQAETHPRYATVAAAGDAEAGFHAAAALIVAGSSVTVAEGSAA